MYSTCINAPNFWWAWRVGMGWRTELLSELTKSQGIELKLITILSSALSHRKLSWQKNRLFLLKIYIVVWYMCLDSVWFKQTKNFAWHYFSWLYIIMDNDTKWGLLAPWGALYFTPPGDFRSNPIQSTYSNTVLHPSVTCYSFNLCASV